MHTDAHRLKLTRAERNALRHAARIGAGLKRSGALLAPKVWMHGYTTALRAMAKLLPDARHFAAFHRRMDRLEKLLPRPSASRGGFHFCKTGGNGSVTQP